MKRLRATTLLIGLAVGALTGCSTNNANDTTASTAVDTTISAATTTASAAETLATEEPAPTPDGTEAPADTAAVSPTDTVALSTPPPTAVTDVAVDPGQPDGAYVGAAADVTTTTCKLDGTSWKMGGKVTNSSGADAKYRIYVAMNVRGSTETKALVQSDIQVPNGQTSDWSATADVTDKDLICILRVERSTPE